MNRKTRDCFLLSAALLFLMGISHVSRAQDAGAPWGQLSQDEKKVLQPYADRWEQLSPQKQISLQKGAGRPVILAQRRGLCARSRRS